MLLGCWPLFSSDALFVGFGFVVRCVVLVLCCLLVVGVCLLFDSNVCLLHSSWCLMFVVGCCCSLLDVGGCSLAVWY